MARSPISYVRGTNRVCFNEHGSTLAQKHGGIEVAADLELYIFNLYTRSTAQQSGRKIIFLEDYHMAAERITREVRRAIVPIAVGEGRSSLEPAKFIRTCLGKHCLKKDRLWQFCSNVSVFCLSALSLLYKDIYLIKRLSIVCTRTQKHNISVRKVSAFSLQ